MAWPIINTLLAAAVLYLAYATGALPTGVVSDPPVVASSPAVTSPPAAEIPPAAETPAVSE